MTQTKQGRRRAAKGEADAFYLRAVEHDDPDECLIWPFRLTPDGYARHSKREDEFGTRQVTRQVLMATVGPPPEPDYHAAHSCRNRDCVNRFHLRWATVTENQRERFKDGTSNRGGERSGTAKLNAELVRRIRQDPRPHDVIAAEIGVAASTIYNARTGITWGHVV